MAYDLVIKNSRIVDGSGQPSFQGDVAVQDGKIVEVGKVSGPAGRTIDGTGLALAPGFIDNHTHYDAQVTWGPLCTSSCYHGVTSVVMGHCGLALAPARPADHDPLAQMLSRIEAIPIEALRAWLLLFVDAVATKQIIAPALNALVGDHKKVFEASYAQIHEAIRVLVKLAVQAGDIRKDLDPMDLLRALVGGSNVASSPDWQQSAKRLVDILITGARPVTGDKNRAREKQSPVRKRR